MSVGAFPAPRIRLTRIVPAALLAVGLAVGSVAAVHAVADGDSHTKAPAISAVHGAQSFQSARAAEYRASSTPAPRPKWSAVSGLPASPAASEFPTSTSEDDITVRYGAH
jgi:hypothetical protein